MIKIQINLIIISKVTKFTDLNIMNIMTKI